MPICEDAVQDLTVTIALLAKQNRVFSSCGAGGFLEEVFSYLGDIQVVAEKKVFLARRKVQPGGTSLWTIVCPPPDFLAPHVGTPLDEKAGLSSLLGNPMPIAYPELSLGLLSSPLPFIEPPPLCSQY